MRRLLKTTVIGALFMSAVIFVGYKGLIWLDHAYPPPLPARLTVSAEVNDRDGQLLRSYTTPEGYWRLQTEAEHMDPNYLKMLIAYEDKRFYEHNGLDPYALFRAGFQLVRNGRITSGGSTITMQLARLIEPRQQRNLTSKLRQMARAIQLERRLTKQEILDRYLTLAPYGGNIEGVRSASFAYFNKEPIRLTSSEAALLVALPQLPERRRPDRYIDNAYKARDRVLIRMAEANIITHDDATHGQLEQISSKRYSLPSLAAHLSDRALINAPNKTSHQLTVKKSVQTGLEQVAREAALKLGPKISVAIIMADSRDGTVLGSAGSADYFDNPSKGWIDMSYAIRSPGSALKPFIYGLAFEEGLIAQETIIEDKPTDFAGYRPQNFDMSYQGDVSIRQSLQMSLNVPTISLLDAIGPTRLISRFRQVGVDLRLPKDKAAGLAIGLGGAGISLRDLVQLYTGLANGGKVSALIDGTVPEREPQTAGYILDPNATWQIGDILSGVLPPAGSPRRGIAYKTGTSYGYRDAWSVGYDGRYVIGVWVGRPDGGSVPGLSGYLSAAPILFDAFSRSNIAAVAIPRAPISNLRMAREDLPLTLKHFSSNKDQLPSTRKVTEPSPTIIFPSNGAHIELTSDQNSPEFLTLKLQGGRAPFRWLANGKPISGAERRRTSSWVPDETGYSTLTVIDSVGRAASVKVFIE